MPNFVPCKKSSKGKPKAQSGSALLNTCLGIHEAVPRRSVSAPKESAILRPNSAVGEEK